MTAQTQQTPTAQQTAAAPNHFAHFKSLAMAGLIFGFRSQRYKDFADGWIRPLECAQRLLKERLRDERVIRLAGYDIFVPPKRKDPVKPHDPDFHYPGMIFYPGWRINHNAYAPIASKLSDEGIVVVVVAVPLENFRSTLGQRPVQAEIARYLRIMYKLLVDLADYPVRDWAVGGHADGGHLAMKIAMATSPGTSKLILWGCGPQPHTHTPTTVDIFLRKPNKSVDLSKSQTMEVLVLNGSEDPLFLWQRASFRKNLLPESLTVSLTILGGNHSGFGHYNSRSPEKDGERTIPLEQQQAIAVENTSLFLKEQLRSPLALVKEERRSITQRTETSLLSLSSSSSSSSLESMDHDDISSLSSHSQPSISSVSMTSSQYRAKYASGIAAHKSKIQWTEVMDSLRELEEENEREATEREATEREETEREDEDEEEDDDMEDTERADEEEIVFAEDVYPEKESSPLVQ